MWFQKSTQISIHLIFFYIKYIDIEGEHFAQNLCTQVVDFYKEACRALENSETASMLGKIQKDWKKLVQMKIYYFAAVAHVGVLV